MLLQTMSNIAPGVAAQTDVLLNFPAPCLSPRPDGQESQRIGSNSVARGHCTGWWDRGRD